MKSRVVLLSLFHMKRIVACFTVVVYLAFACGVMVNYHFCMDRYTTFGLYQPAGNSCHVCGMHTKKKGCCHDEVKIIRIQSDYQATSLSWSLKNVPLPQTINSASFSENLLRQTSVVNKIDHSPPFLNIQDIYLQDRVFRI
jgi:hypothetical protein